MKPLTRDDAPSHAVLDGRKESFALADWYPYWSVDAGQVRWSQWANDAVSALPVHMREVDPVAVLSLLSHEFVCLDRTLVKSVSRLPWLGGVDASGRSYTFAAPPHGSFSPGPGAIADELWRLLGEELRRACSSASQVYVLLSGGMDSRVVAGALHSLQQSGQLKVPVEAVTWGIGATRDVVYAERLAHRLGWKWTHVPLSSETYWENFETAAEFLGAECDPKHLHRMTWFESAPPGSVVVAGSYGDSVGHAEYGSVHLTKVAPLEPRDRFGLLRREWREHATPLLQEDIWALRGRHGVRSETGYRELERQAHYMRRQLCHAMCIINRWARVHQAFTSPEVFSYMWSIAPEQRTDAIYRHLLRKHAPDLLDVEWARTGGRYATKAVATDRLPKGFHRYGAWLRNDHRDRLISLLTDGTLERLEIFDQRQLAFMIREWTKERVGDDTMLATQLSMLGTLSSFARRFEIGPPAKVRRAKLRDTVTEVPRQAAARARQLVARLSRPHRVRS